MRSVGAIHILRSYGFGGGERQLLNLMSQDGHKESSILILLFKDSTYSKYLNEAEINYDFLLPFELKSSNYLFLEFSRLLILLPLLQALLVLKVMRLKSYSIVVHGAQSLYVAQLAKFLLKNKRFYYAHRGLKNKRPWDSFTRVFYKGFEKIIGVSHAVSKSMKAYVDESKIITIPNGVYLPAKRISNRSEGPFKLITVGRLIPLKDQAFIIRSLSLINSQNWVLDIIGDGPELESLLSLAEEKGIADRVNFLGFCKDVLQRLPKYDIFVFSSTSEGMSNSILEAMASSLPIVAVDCPGVTECVDGNGFISARDESEFGGYLQSIFSETVDIRTLSIRSYDRAIKEYSIESNARKYADLIFRIR